MEFLQKFVIFLLTQKNEPSLLTVKNYKADINQFINWFENELKSTFDPSAVTLQTLEKYKKTRNLSPSSMQRHVSSLRKFFNFLKVEKIISHDLLEKRTVSAEALAEADPWMLRNFKSFLYEYKKSNLTIKNYINDIKTFFAWLGEAALVKYAWNIEDKNLLDKINFSVIEEYKQRLMAAKFSPLTINRKLSSLRNYVSWAKSQGFIPGHAEFISASQPEYIKNAIPNEKMVYSPFPPARLIQKSLKGINSLFDNLFIMPLAGILQNLQYLFWRIKGKKIFKKNVILNETKDPMGFFANAQNNNVQNIQREFYAPLNISTRYLPLYKKIWHYIRYARPRWYKKYHQYPLAHYFHFAILMILSCAIGFGIYNSLFANTQQENSVLATTSFAQPRILSFRGKLADSSETAITGQTAILFSLYGDENASSQAALWHETNSVKPDSDGTFSILLGKTTPISDAVFSQNSKLFLGITVGNSPELLPRQELAAVPTAGNSETLQGLEPITNTIKTSNVVLALDSSGNLSIADSKSHTFQATGGQFILSGNILSLTTIPGSNSNVEIAPDGMGKIDFSKPIQNSSNNNNLSVAAGSVEFDDTVAILATTSAQAALYINQNSTGTLISASTNGIAKFTVTNDGTGTFAGGLGANGNITLGQTGNNTITFNARVAQNSSLVPITASGTNNLGASDLPWDNAYVNNIYAVKLDVQDSQSATAAAQIFNTNSGTDADGLIVKLGNTSADAVATTNHFLSFETSGIGIVGSVQGSGGKGVTYATSGVADFAEYFRKDVNLTIPFGSVVCMQENGLVTPCGIPTGRDDIIGVASERPAFLGGENLGNGSIAVGLVGQIETLASIVNGVIKPGDLLTASDIPGVAIKTTKAGQVVGRALEDLETIDEAKIVGYYDPDSKEYRSKDNFPDIPIKSNIIKIAKIYALINVSWYDPNAYLAQNGDLIISSTGSNGHAVTNSKNENLTNIGGFLEVVSANIKTGLINAQEVIAHTLVVTSDSIIVNGQSLKDYIVQTVNESGIMNQESGIISPVVNTNQLSTNIISPLGESLIVRLATPSAEIQNSEFIIQNSSGSAVAKIDDQGNASFSGTLSSEKLAVSELEVSSDASISGTLRAGNIIADSIAGLNEKISAIYNSSNFADLASYSAQLSYIPDFAAERAQFNQGLMVFGPTSLSDLSIAGRLSVGGTMFVTENSIETLGADLSLQSLKQGGLSIMSGLVYIDTAGNVRVQGDLSVSGKLAVSGDIIASGSGTFSKINFNLIAPVLAISETEVIASSSAGVANISPYQSELTIKNFLVTDKSVIYITPVGTPSAQTPFLMRQLVNEFTVGVQSPTNHSLDFNWLIVN